MDRHLLDVGGQRRQFEEPRDPIRPRRCCPWMVSDDHFKIIGDQAVNLGLITTIDRLNQSLLVLGINLYQARLNRYLRLEPLARSHHPRTGDQKTEHYAARA